MTEPEMVTVPPEDDGQRLDRWLKKRMPFGLVQKLIRKGAIRIDGKKAKADTRILEGQEIRIPAIKDAKDVEKKKPSLSDEDVAFIRSLVVYDDDDIVAINKPAGLASQGGGKLKRHVDALAEALPNKKGMRPKLIHRLDMDTSGLMVMAREPDTIRKLGKAFKDRRARKVYLAIVTPSPEQMEGTIEAPIGKVSGPHKDKMMLGGIDEKFALTDFVTVEKAGEHMALVAFWPRTGRTHQIRVHATEALQCPILGDEKYGGQNEINTDMGLAERLHLHAWQLHLPHPHKKGQVLELSADFSDDLKESWRTLGFDVDFVTNPFADDNFDT